jgi:hypothetical protein
MRKFFLPIFVLLYRQLSAQFESEKSSFGAQLGVYLLSIERLTANGDIEKIIDLNTGQRLMNKTTGPGSCILYENYLIKSGLQLTIPKFD